MMLKMTFESFSARSYAIDFQTESVLALHKKLKVFLFSANTLSVCKLIAHDPAIWHFQKLHFFLIILDPFA